MDLFSASITVRPQRLLLISTGNVSNKELERLVRVALPDICQALEQSRFVELGFGVNGPGLKRAAASGGSQW